MKISNIFKHTEESRLIFTSDIHYNHRNVLTLDSRPYQSVEEMNDYILKELDEKLRPTDILFDLGDMTWNMRPKKLIDFFSHINTKEKYKVLGNHEKGDLWYPENSIGRKNWTGVFDLLDIQVEFNEEIIPISLSHFPMIDYNHQYQGGIHLFGHTHGHLDEFVKTIPMLMVDLGFSAQLAKEYGSFLIPFDFIYDHLKKKTGGISFKEWAGEKYHSNEALWKERHT